MNPVRDLNKMLPKKKIDKSNIKLFKDRKIDISNGVKSDKVGIVILSHGSKLKKANASLEKTVQVVRQKIALDAIVPAYLQFCQPNLEKSLKNLITKKCRTVIIIPFFLFNGNHVTRDIPHIIEKEKRKFPKVNFIYTKNLGEDARITDIVSDMAREAIAKWQ